MLLKFKNVLKIVKSTLLLELKPEPELERKPVKKKDRLRNTDYLERLLVRLFLR